MPCFFVPISVGDNPDTIRNFFIKVIDGQQEQADGFLRAADNTQEFLKTSKAFMDLSGRTFNCTAFEYAFWARDFYMCDMLLKHMDNDTKHLSFELINDIISLADDGKPRGLRYEQDGVTHRSIGFDFNPFLEEMWYCIANYRDWWSNNPRAIGEAWNRIGLIQKNFPAHVVQEYRETRSFASIPSFAEAPLRGHLMFDVVGDDDNRFCWYDVKVSGVVIRGSAHGRGEWGFLSNFLPNEAKMDLNAIAQLGRVRNAQIESLHMELYQSITRTISV